MKEIFGDLLDQECDAICITTNGSIKKNGEAVMGRGCALEANRRWKCARTLGYLIKKCGNNTTVLLFKDFDITLLKSGPRIELNYNVVSFPVKYNYWEKADISLIMKSAKELRIRAKVFKWKKIVLPYPGCGAGGLKWKDVKKVLEPILDDRFYMITNKKMKEEL